MILATFVRIEGCLEWGEREERETEATDQVISYWCILATGVAAASNLVVRREAS